MYGRAVAKPTVRVLAPAALIVGETTAITIEEFLRRIPEFSVAADADTQCSGGIVAQINRLVLEWDI